MLLATVITPPFYCRESSVLAQGFTPLDFDGDSVSDVLTATPSGTSLSWVAVGSSTEQEEVKESFGLNTDMPAPACWLAEGEPVLGVVRLSTNGKALSWRALKDDGLIAEREFGLPGDLVISGGDFDGDRIADAAVVRVRRNRLKWGLAYNHLSESPGKTRTFTFGVDGDRAFILKVEGSNDWLGVFGVRKGRKVVAVLKDPVTKKERTVRGFPRSLSTGARPRPIPLVGPEGEGVLAFVVEDGAESVVLAYSLKGERITRVVLPGIGSVSVGNYLSSEAGDEIAIQASDRLRVINPVTQGREFRGAVSGPVVGAVNVKVIQGIPTPTPLPTATVVATPTPSPTATRPPTNG
jgi:hypothetical protein